MKAPNIRIISLIVLAIIQLGFGGYIVTQYEQVKDKGEEFKFRIQPVDPHDPFRGKYINLRFADDDYSTNGTSQYQRRDMVYAEIIKDKEGFAKIGSLNASQSQGIPSVHVEINRVFSAGKGRSRITVKFPFSRYYMGEDEAEKAEKAVRSIATNNSNDVYAIVSIYNGKTVLKDVMVGDIPLQEWIRQHP
ncbi:MAG: GDYXXLXY domain-containing protein [Bacteroidota bacterium]